jgi:hypothetical protein
MISVVKKTAESKVKQDKNGRNYKTCTFSKMGMREVDIIGVGKVVIEDKAVETSVNLYEESYLDGKAHYGYNTPVNTPSQSFLFGDIVTRKVAPYVINSVNKTTGEVTERTVDTYTTVVFCASGLDATAFESVVATTFKSRGHELVGGTITAPAVTAEYSSVDIAAGI